MQASNYWLQSCRHDYFTKKPSTEMNWGKLQHKQMNVRHLSLGRGTKVTSWGVFWYTSQNIFFNWNIQFKLHILQWKYITDVYVYLYSKRTNQQIHSPSLCWWPCRKIITGNPYQFSYHFQVRENNHTSCGDNHSLFSISVHSAAFVLNLRQFEMSGVHIFSLDVAYGDAVMGWTQRDTGSTFNE